MSSRFFDFDRTLLRGLPAYGTGVAEVRRRVSNVINVVHPPTGRVRVGPRVQGLSGTDFEGDTEKIMAAITDLLTAEAPLRRTPTADELARTMPPGQAAMAGQQVAP